MLNFKNKTMKKLLLLTKTLLAAVLLCVGQNAWGDDVYTPIYQRNVTFGDANIWTADDVTAWGGNANLSIDVPTTEEDLTAHYGIGHYSKPTAFTSTKTFSIEENSKIKFELTWFFGSAPGMNKDGTSFNYNFIQFGDKVRLSWRQGTYKLYLSTDGASGIDETTAIFTGSNSSYSKTITIIFDTSKRTVESFFFDGTDHTSKLSGALEGDFNKISLGYIRNTKPSYDSPNRITTLTVSECEQEVTNVGYTVNYKLDEETVKTVSSTSVVGANITADVAIDGTEVGYEGNHYLITAAEAPSMTLVSDAASNVLNVPVRAPYTATLNVTRTIGGVAQTPVVTNLTETDAKVCSWNYTYPLYVQKDGVYYVADVTSSFGESGTFTDGETINKTVAYTNPDYSVVYFGEPNEATGTNTAYSNGATGFIKGGVTYDDDRVIRLGQLAAGTYRLITNITGDAARNLVVGDYTAGTASFPTALVTITTTGAKDESFTVDGTQLISISGKDQGSGKFNQSATLDYVLVKASSVSATIGAKGWATFSSDYALDFTGISDFEAYMITGHDGTVVTKSQVTGTVPAGTGLLLKGDAGNYTIPVVASSSTDVSANKLVAGTGESVSAEGGKTKYVLGVSGSDEAEFQKIVSEAATVPTGKAYLQFNEEILARTMSFVGDITGVETVEAVSEAKAKEGKFIENGKLVIVRNGVKFNAAGAKLY